MTVVDFIEADFAVACISISVVLLLVVTKALNREKMKVHVFFDVQPHTGSKRKISFF